MSTARNTRIAQVEFCAHLNKPIKPAALFDVLLHAMQMAPSKNLPLRTLEQKGKLAESLPLKILVAEDNTVNQKVVQQLLAHLGYRSDVVANGIEVLDAMERQNYDVVLMNVQMPEMDGLEATRRLRAHFGENGLPRVIAMTANAMPGDREKCLAASMNAYVSKPVELDDVRTVLVAVAGKTADETLEVIDLRRIDQLLELQDENNPRLLSDIIELFCADSPKHLENIARALADRNAEQLKSAAHRFLSSIENLGAQRMRKYCMELERLAKTGTLQEAQALKEAEALLVSLQREFDTAKQHLLGMAAPQ